MLPVDAVERRAKIAGIAGWITFGVGILGFATCQPLRYMWIAVGFIGLGGVLRGLVLLTAAARMKRDADQWPPRADSTPPSGRETER